MWASKETPKHLLCSCFTVEEDGSYNYGCPECNDTGLRQPTEKDFRDAAWMAEMLKERVEEVFAAYAKLKGLSYRSVTNIECAADGTWIYIDYDDYDDPRQARLPMSYLWTPDWEEKLLAEMEAERQAKLAQARRDEAARAAARAKDKADRFAKREERLRSQYERLKAKFEGAGHE